MMRLVRMSALGALALFACSAPATTSTVSPPQVASTEVEAASQAPTGPAKLSFRVMAKEGEGKRGIAAGDTLRSGDKIAMAVSVDQTLYVYVMQFFPDRSAAILFPAAGEDNRIESEMRLPPEGWFQLDDALGDENVYIVASTRPLEEADSQVLATVKQVRESGSVPEDAGSDETSQEVGEEPVAVRDPALDPVEAPDASVGPGEGAESEPVKTRNTKHPVRIKAAGSGKSKKPISKKKPKRPTKPGRASLLSRGLIRVDKDGEGPLVHMQTDEDGVAISVFQFHHAAAK